MKARMCFVAKNDVNGNPRRVHVVWEFSVNNSRADVVAVQDEGYGNLADPVLDAVDLGMVYVEVSEYRDWLKYAKDNPTLVAFFAS